MKRRRKIRRRKRWRRQRKKRRGWNVSAPFDSRETFDSHHFP